MATIFDVINEVGSIQPSIEDLVNRDENPKKHINDGSIINGGIADILNKFKKGYNDPNKKITNELTTTKKVILSGINNIAQTNNTISRELLKSSLLNSKQKEMIDGQKKEVDGQNSQIKTLEDKLKQVKNSIPNTQGSNPDNDEGVGRTTSIKPALSPQKPTNPSSKTAPYLKGRNITRR